MASEVRYDVAAARKIVAPLVLAQFIASYAGSNMNVAVNSIATDIGTSVRGVQTAITLFTLTMAALMIPGSKLTDIWGRKFCFEIGLIIYGIGAIIATLAGAIGVLIVGYSLFEGVGSALMIPPIYILITVSFDDIKTRAKYFGVVSGAAGLGAAAGPLIGGLLTTAISWRASFTLQIIVVALVAWMGRKIPDPGITGPRPRFDLMGTVLSAAGLFFVVLSVLQSRGLFFACLGIGIVFLGLFFIHIVRWEREGKNPLLAPRLFRNRVSNIGLFTQNMQWLVLQGAFFVVSVFVQTVRGYSAVEAGLLLTPAIAGMLLSSLVAERMASRRPQATLIRMGFALTALGMLLLLLFARADSGFITYGPGLFLMGIGIGVMLTASVNVVQSSFPEKDQGEISGLSRSISNLGSSLGTAIVGTVLVSGIEGNTRFAAALASMLGFALLGLLAAFALPVRKPDVT